MPFDDICRRSLAGRDALGGCDRNEKGGLARLTFGMVEGDENTLAFQTDLPMICGATCAVR